MSSHNTLFRGLCEIALALDCKFNPTLEQVQAVATSQTFAESFGERAKILRHLTVATDYRKIVSHVVTGSPQQIERLE
jgi:hypothetical protein